MNVELPYILGHENAGWVEAVGDGVTTIKPGDAVIVHPVITCGLCQACRAGEDMHCVNLAFPGITQNGGFAEYLHTGERAIIKLPEGLEPKAIAPYADAGITAYRAAQARGQAAHAGHPLRDHRRGGAGPHRGPGAARALRDGDHRGRPLGRRPSSSSGRSAPTTWSTPPRRTPWRRSRS